MARAQWVHGKTNYKVNLSVLLAEMAERHDAKAVLNLARNIVRKLQEIMHPSDQN